MSERGIKISHTTIFRWVIKLVPFIEKMIIKDKHPAGASWRMDETYIKVNKSWRYLWGGHPHRAVDKKGNTIDFLLTAKRDTKAALDKMNSKRVMKAEIRQLKYLNNIIEQDHRNIKRIISPMLGFKTFRTAKITITGIEIAAMFRKKQISLMELFSPTPVQHWQLLAGNIV